MAKKRKMLYEDLPVYEIVVNDDDNTGIKLLSIVENPAIEITGYAFSKVDDIQKNMSFTINKDEQVIAGPAMVPNKRIYRKDGDMEYYVVFSAETIKKIVQKFVRDNNNRSINVDHSNTMVKAYIQEHWIIADSTYDKSKAYGFDLPAGSWFVCVKIEDENFWKTEVKELNKMGFSIEGILGQKLMYMSQQLSVDDVIDTLTEEEIEYIFAGEYRYRLPPPDTKSKWHTHPNCNCSFLEGVWTFEPTPDGKYPCEVCIAMSERYKKWYKPGKESGGPASTGFNSMNFEKISFDYHQTLNTPDGMKLAKDLIDKGNDVHIVTNASESESGRIIKRKAEEVGIPIENIHYAKGDKLGTLKKLGIKKHYDNNRKEIDSINEAGLKGMLFENQIQQFVEPSKGEKEQEFISRCISYVMNKGETEDTSQAYAICKTKWDNK